MTMHVPTEFEPVVAPSPLQKKIIFVADNIAGFHTIVASLQKGADVVVLDSQRDALAQMNEALTGTSGLDAIHVYSHGSAGRIDLGRITLDAGNVGEHKEALAQLGRALSSDGDILLYGCETGAGATLIEQIALHTGADVAASVDKTGGAAGANWTLEAQLGSIETAALAPEGFAGTLATSAVVALRPINTASAFITGSSTDKDGNVYISGTYSGSVDFDPSAGDATLTQATSTGKSAVFAAKYSATGGLLWAKSFDGPTAAPSAYGHSGGDIAVDSLGNVYVSGNYINNIDLDPGAGSANISTPSSNYNGFMVKLDASGNYTWGKNITGNTGSSAGLLALDKHDNVYIAGTARPGGNIGGVSLNTTANQNYYVAKLDAGGNVVWTRSSADAGGDGEVSDLAVDSQGNAFLVGKHFDLRVNTGSGTLAFNADATAADYMDGFIWKLNSDGSYGFAQAIGGDAAGNDDIVSDVSIDAQDNVYITGYFTGTTQFGTGSPAVTSTEDYQAFLAKFDNTGGHQWVKRWTGVWEVAKPVFDAQGNIYLPGMYQQGADMDPNAGMYTLGGTANLNAHAMKLSATGDFIWARDLGGAVWDGLAKTRTMVQLRPDGNLVVVGNPAGVAADADPGAGTTTVSKSFWAAWAADASGYASSNTAPTLTTMAPIIGAEDMVRSIGIDDLKAAGNEADSDGSVSAFVVRSVASGTLKIGTSAATATAWAAGSNDIIDATRIAYWTPAAEINGSVAAFHVVAKDNGGAVSPLPVQVTIDLAPVNDAPSIVELDGDASNVTPGVPAYIDPLSTNVGGIGDDSATFDGGYLLVTQTSGTGGGAFSFDTNGYVIAASPAEASNASGTIVQGHGVFVRMTDTSWLQIGTVEQYSEAPGATILKIAFNANAVTGNQTTVDGLISYLMYTADGVGARGFEMVLNDGQASSAPAAFSVNAIGVTGVSAHPMDGLYGAGRLIDISVSFNTAVDVSGTPSLLLNSGGSASYLGGSGSSTLLFRYEVQPGDSSADLDVAGSAALLLNGGTINDVDSANGALAAGLTLPAPGAPGSLGAAKAIVIDGLVPTDIALSNASVATSAAAGATVGLLSSTDATSGDAFTYTLVAGSGATDNAAFTIVGNELRAIDPSSMTAGAKTVRVQTRDAAGNVYEEAFALEVTSNPTVAITSDRTTVGSGAAVTLTFTFSAPPHQFGLDDITYSGGSISTVEATGDPRVFTATFVPDSGIEQPGMVVSVGAGRFDDGNGNPNLASTQNAVIDIDTKSPTVLISSPGATLRAGQVMPLTFTFSEAPAGFHAGDVTVAGGYLSEFSATSDPRVFTAVLTPESNAESVAIVTVGAPPYVDRAGNVGAAAELRLPYDTQRPVATLTVSDRALSAGETAQVTVSFSEAVSGLSASQLTVSGGTLGDMTSTDGGRTWSASFVPDANTQTSSQFVLQVAGATDAAGNTIESPVVSETVVIDTRAPVLTISAARDTLKAGDTTVLTFSFSEPPAGFTDADIGVTGGSLSPLRPTTDPSVFEATFTPAADVDRSGASVQVGAGAYADSAGNAGAAATLALVVDTRAPGATIDVGASALKAGEQANVTIAFSEAVADFDNTDLLVENGTLSTVSSSDGGRTWHAVFTPQADLEDASGAITLTLAGVRDLAGNAGGASVTSGNYAVDTIAPTLLISSDATVFKAGESATVTFTFSEAPAGFDMADITVSGGSLTGLAASADPKVYKALFTPAAGVDSLNGAIAVAGASYADAAGNPGAAGNTVSIGGDTGVPTVSISADKTTFRANESTEVKFTFSDAPVGLDAAAIEVSGGLLSGFAPTADARVFMAHFIPTANLDQLAGAIRLPAGAFHDAAGNASVASDSLTLSGDTRAPVVSDAHLSISGASGAGGAFRAGDTVTLTWDNRAGGDANTDIATVVADFSQFGGGSVAATMQDGVWSASYTIGAGTLDAPGRKAGVTVTDHAGNSTTVSDDTGVPVDSQAPALDTPSLALSGATGAGGVFRSGDTVTATWTMAPGAANADIAGVAMDFAQFGGGQLAATFANGAWSASFAIADGALDVAGRTVLVRARDDAGNEAGAASAGAALDNIRPVASAITLAGTPAPNAATVSYTVVFDQAVTGVDVSDFALVASGTTTGVITQVSGGGSTYTVTVDGIAGNGTLRLDLKGAATGIADASGNAAAGGLAGAVHAANFNATPVITSNGGGASATVELAEAQTTVTTVVAVDADQHPLTLSITGGADAALFQLVDGKLAFRAAPAYVANGDNSYEVTVSADDGHGGIGSQALTVNVLSDLDRDGMADLDDDDIDNDGNANSTESPVGNAFGSGQGDGNGDGIADAHQANVASLRTASASQAYATLEVAPGYVINPAASSPAPSPLPRGVSMPAGQLDFSIGNVAPGGTVTMSIYVDAALRINAYYKQDNTGKWSNIAKSVTTVGNKTRITFELTDGGLHDADKTVNGSISDPGGVAVITPVITSNGGLETATIGVQENTDFVTTVGASAVGDAGSVTYSINGGADGALFAIDSATGQLRFVHAPDFENAGDADRDNSYQVTVTASDAHGSATQALTVKVLDLDEMPPTRSDTVDGVRVETGTRVNPDGSSSTTVVIPVVAPTRSEEVGNQTKADIPLVSAGGAPVLTAAVPTGFGLQVAGSAAPRGAAMSLTDLIREIQAHTEAGSHDQNQLTGAGSGFLQALPADAPLLVQTIVPTILAGSTSAPAEALVIAGTPRSSADAPLTALVIDTRGLPQGATIELQHVEFATVIGAVNVTGGAGKQLVWGDGAGQTIVLGEDDDILHGGAGDDTVGSAGGNDQVFGDEGKDLVFGGAGNDLVDGGSGIDTVLLAGTSRADYSMRVVDGKLTMTHLNGGVDGTDVVANVEILRFGGAGPDLGAAGTLERLYDTLFDRGVDAAGKSFWLAQHANGMALRDIAGHLLGSGEALALPDAQTSAQFVDALYQRALGRPADSAALASWSEQLDQGRIDRAGVLLAVANSAEKLALDPGTPVELSFAQTDVASVLRLYGTLFGRSADAAGLNYWTGASEAGMTLGAIADAFLATAEAKQRYEAMSDAQFVEALYQLGLQREGSLAEVAAWTGALDRGASRGDVLLSFADSAEMLALVGVMSTSFDLT